MDEQVMVTIGGEAVAVPPMNFAALKRAWPAIQALPGQTNLVAQAASTIEIVASALARTRPELSVAEIEARLVGLEFVDLVGTLPRILEASGLAPRGEKPSGEVPAGP